MPLKEEHQEFAREVFTKMKRHFSKVGIVLTKEEGSESVRYNFHKGKTAMDSNLIFSKGMPFGFDNGGYDDVEEFFDVVKDSFDDHIKSLLEISEKLNSEPFIATDYTFNHKEDVEVEVEVVKSGHEVGYKNVIIRTEVYKGTVEECLFKFFKQTNKWTYCNDLNVRFKDERYFKYYTEFFYDSPQGVANYMRGGGRMD